MGITRAHRLKPQSGFARGVCQSLDSAVVEKAAPIEDDVADTGRLGLGRDRLPHFGRLGHAIALGLQADGGGGGQRAAAIVVDELRVDVIQAAEDRQSGALLRAADVNAHALVALQPVDFAVRWLDHPAALAPLPALPALRRIFSPRYMTPLPLYGSGGRMPRILAATWPTSSIEIPLTENLVGSWTSIDTPGGGLYLIGCE